MDAGYAGRRWLVVLLWFEWLMLTGSHTLKMENEGVIYVDEEETKYTHQAVRLSSQD